MLPYAVAASNSFAQSLKSSSYISFASRQHGETCSCLFLLLQLHLFIHFTPFICQAQFLILFIHSFIWFQSKSTWRANLFSKFSISTPAAYTSPHRPTRQSLQSSPVQSSPTLTSTPTSKLSKIPHPINSPTNVAQHSQKSLLHRPPRRRPGVPGLSPREASALVERPRPKRFRSLPLSPISLVCP